MWGNYTEQIYNKLGGTIIARHSCVQGGWAGGSNIDADPKFASGAGGDLRLGLGSPCIDSGNNAAVPGDILTDLGGLARFFDDPNVADCQWWPGTCGTAPIVDMGAYESNGVPPLTITLQPVGQMLCEDGTAVFTVAATGVGTLTYKWQKDGVDLADGGQFSGVVSDTLTVTLAIPADNGDYSCIVTDANGSTFSGEAALVVKPETVITGQPADATGTPATFTVAATGDGTLTYQWKKNGVNLADGIHYAGTTTTALTVANCACDNIDAYCCVVTGGCTMAESEAATLTCQPGDFDLDTDVDQEDYGAMQICLDAILSDKPECGPMDLDGNGLIGTQDVVRFIACMSGPQAPGDPVCGR